MNIVICWFLGLLFVVSGDEISMLINILHASLVCNILGCAFICYGIFIFLNNINKKIEYRNSNLECLNNLIQNLPSNKEYEQGIELIKSLYEGQEQCKDFVRELYGKLENFTAYYKENSPSNKNIENLYNQLEILQKENNKNIIICNETLKKIELLGQKSCEQAENLRKMLNEILNMPQELGEQIENMLDAVNSHSAELLKKIEYLLEDLEEQEKKRVKNFDKMLENLRDYCEENNEEIMEHIKSLSQQYMQFEKTVNVIVESMTNMAKSDIEVMKGFLNG